MFSLLFICVVGVGRMFQRKEIRLGDLLSYSCRQCGTCCQSIGVQLSPLDVWCLARKLGLSTGQVLERHAQLQLEKRSGRLYVFLRGALEGSCSFLTNQLCTIYDARPGACRMHPIGSYMGLVEGEDGPVSFWGFERRISPSCPGWEPGRDSQATLRDYIAGQGAGARISLHLLYTDFLNRLYRESQITGSRGAGVELVNCLFNLDLHAGPDVANPDVANTEADAAGAGPELVDLPADFRHCFTLARARARDIFAPNPRPGG